jgi:hypothetical protein
VYLLALGGVSMALLAWMVDAVLSVSRRPHWPAAQRRPELDAVDVGRTPAQPLPVDAGRRGARAGRAEPERLVA